MVDILVEPLWKVTLSQKHLSSSHMFQMLIYEMQTPEAQGDLAVQNSKASISNASK